MHFRWTEDIPGHSPIRERGVLVAFGLTRVEPLASPLYASATLEVWGGRADFDGYRVEGWVPYSTDTQYLGTREEIALGASLTGIGASTFRPSVGIGHRYWQRSRSNEVWNTAYGKVGARFDRRAGDQGYFVEAGALAPFHTRVQVDWSSSGYGDFVLRPGRVVTPFAAAGWQAGRLSIGITFEQLDFRRSPPAAVSKSAGATGAVLDNSSAYQPDSKSSSFGVAILYRF